MKLNMLGWESEGLRCPDMRIDLTMGGVVPRVALVQMPNGTGKTTTLQLIEAAMDGRAELWPGTIVQNFRRPGESHDKGKFILRLSVDGDPLTFEMNFDFLEHVVTYSTTYRQELRGVVQRYDPPQAVKRFLNDKFVQLFIFDGELAHNLLDGKKTKAAEAIDTLCQLEHLARITDTASSNWRTSTKNQGAKTSSGLSAWEGKEKRYKERVAYVTRVREDLVREIATRQSAIDDVNKQLDAYLQEHQEANQKKKALEGRIRLHESSLDAHLKKSLELLRQPQNLSPFFAGALATLKDQFDRVRLPESTSRQFFLELANEKNCVCGRPISEHERQVILEHGSQYLANEVYAFINGLKTDINANVIEVQNGTCVHDSLAELQRLRRALTDTKTDLEVLESGLISESGDQAHQLDEHRKKLKDELEQNSEALKKIDSWSEADKSEDSFSIKALESELKYIRQQIAQITDTIELRQKLDIVEGIVTRTRELARERLRSSIKSQCNERLKRVLSGDPICIESIGNSLSLQDQSGASVGQTLAVGYTFLATLLGRGAHKFPLVVDSPAGALDDNVRKQVAKMIPGLCDQFVAFTISTEREHFLPALEAAAGDSIVYLTAYRNAGALAEITSSLPPHAQKTNDGVVVSGREFFSSFVFPEEQE